MKKTTNRNQTRSPVEALSYRSLSVRLQADPLGPATLDVEKRSVEVVAATESPALVMDLERWEIVPEVLLMSGVRLPKSRQVPLLDTHSRWSSSDVIGSARALRVEGNQLLAKAHFSEVEPAPDIFRKIQEGHLTDFSIGYRTNKAVWIPEGQVQKVDGRSFTGPVKVATDWTVKELSTTPIGADEQAKARSEHHQRKEAPKMPEWLKKWLEERGLYREGITEAEARSLFDEKEMKRAAQPETPVVPAQPVAYVVQPPPVDEQAVRAEAIRNEQARILEIRAMCERHECPDVGDAAIRDNLSLDEARKAVMDRLRPTFTGGMGFAPAIEPGIDERDKFRAAATGSLMLRCGTSMDKPAPGSDDFRGWTLKELSRECLRRAGQSTTGHALEMVGRALTMSDLPNILADTANKQLYEGYANAEETWKAWCATGSVSDFKATTIARAGETDDLEIVPEGAEYTYGSLSDAKETFQLATYGKLLMITRQAIINDDLQAISDVPRMHGEAAARKVGDLPYAVLTVNANMGDGAPLFVAGHSNIGVPGAVLLSTIAEGIKLMRLQKNLASKQRLNIRAQYFIAPAALEGTAEQFFGSGQIGGAVATDAGRANLINPYAGTRFTRVYDARLDDTSATMWYLAGPKGKTVTVFFLNGVQTPYMESRDGWSVDGIEYKVRIDAVAKAVDWKALVRNAGA